MNGFTQFKVECEFKKPILRKKFYLILNTKNNSLT